MTRFSVNLNKVALLRNSRGSSRPDVVAMARRAIAAGVHGITVHPRPDERHTRMSDVRELAPLVARHPNVEFNVEGYPFERFMELVLQVRPDQVTLVPDAENQLTSDHGWDAVTHQRELALVLARLRSAGIRSSLFLDPVNVQVDAAARAGADRIELYTAPYASAFAAGSYTSVLAEFTAAAQCAQSAGLGVNAGHDLDLDNLPTFLSKVPGVLEVSIGHAVICESLDYGFEATLAKYLKIVAP